jgi:hypothetical protein
MERFEMWCCARLEKTMWTDRVRKEVLRTAKERNILQTTKRRKANGIGYILRRNCLIKHVIEGKRGKDKSDERTRKKT